MEKEIIDEQTENLAVYITDQLMEENNADIHNENYGRMYLAVYMDVLTQLGNLNEIKTEKTIKM